MTPSTEVMDDDPIVLSRRADARTAALQSRQILVPRRGRHASVLLDRDRHPRWLRQVERRCEHGSDTALRIGFEEPCADWRRLLREHPQLINGVLTWPRQRS